MKKLTLITLLALSASGANAAYSTEDHSFQNADSLAPTMVTEWVRKKKDERDEFASDSPNDTLFPALLLFAGGDRSGGGFVEEYQPSKDEDGLSNTSWN